jgi:hypothetical protein
LALVDLVIFFQEIKTPEREEMAGRGTFLLWLWNLLEVKREGELKVSTQEEVNEVRQQRIQNYRQISEREMSFGAERALADNRFQKIVIPLALPLSERILQGIVEWNPTNDGFRIKVKETKLVKRVRARGASLSVAPFPRIFDNL